MHRLLQREQDMFKALEDIDYYMNFPAIQDYLRWKKSQAGEDVDDEYEALTVRLEQTQGLYAVAVCLFAHVQMMTMRNVDLHRSPRYPPRCSRVFIGLSITCMSG
jgi:hypothetical protein